MSGASRIGDKNQVGGAIMRGSDTVMADGKPLGLVGSIITEHAPWPRLPHSPHICAVVSVGSPTVFADGRPVARVGSINSCGHSMVEGSPTVFVP